MRSLRFRGSTETKLLLFGGWESASRGAGVTLQIVGERLGITDQFMGVDQIEMREDGSFEVLERVEGGKHQVSVCAGAPAVLGWATGNLAEPRNNPQIGMANMRTVMPALQKARQAAVGRERAAIRVSEFAEAAAADARGERYDTGRYRAGACGVDRSGVMAESILVLTHADETGSSLTKASLEAVSGGQGTGGAAEFAARNWDRCGGCSDCGPRSRSTLTRVYLASRVRRSRKRATRADAAACEALCKAAQATIVLAPESSRFARVAAGVAHRLGGSIDTHITSIRGEGGMEVSRWFYRQRIEAVITRTARPWILLLDAGYAMPRLQVNRPIVTVELLLLS